eukprot:TRINITY_DN455_c0_g2_i4.p1 TRINITY_DN455_c0_g2~~TRINITY_DN455_c0_g2_i4.p1  ORF type:complete len:140 (+),score=18.14 TRINITY_DN455_c0_g2_i4:67-486(+)
MNVINQVIAVLSLFVLAVSGCDDTNPQNDYCYRELSSGGLVYSEYKCICPWSTCERNSNIVSPLYDCKITGFSIAFIVVGSVLTCIGIGLCIFCCVKCCCNKPTQQANSGEPVYAYPAQGGEVPPPQDGAQAPPKTEVV